MASEGCQGFGSSSSKLFQSRFGRCEAVSMDTRLSLWREVVALFTDAEELGTRSRLAPGTSNSPKPQIQAALPKPEIPMPWSYTSDP